MLILSMFVTADATIIKRWGKPATFTPTIDGPSHGLFYVVVLLRDDEAADFFEHNAPLLVLFGTLKDSGFVALNAPTPKKNDRITFDGADYRIYDVKFDDAGGTEDSGGMFLYCDRDGIF